MHKLLVSGCCLIPRLLPSFCHVLYKNGVRAITCAAMMYCVWNMCGFDNQIMPTPTIFQSLMCWRRSHLVDCHSGQDSQLFLAASHRLLPVIFSGNCYNMKNTGSLHVASSDKIASERSG